MHKKIKKKRIQLLLVLTAVAVSFTLLTGAQQIPGIKAPPGYTAKVTSTTSRYDFSKLNREIPLQFDAFIYQPNEITKGWKEVTKFKTHSKISADFFNNPTGLVPSLGTLNRKVSQTFTGKGNDEGSILYFEFAQPLPADARKLICRLLYKQDEKPVNKDTKDELLVGNRMIILWSFKNPISQLKQDHQRKTFDLIGAYAQEWMKSQGK